MADKPSFPVAFAQTPPSDFEAPIPLLSPEGANQTQQFQHGFVVPYLGKICLARPGPVEQQCAVLGNHLFRLRIVSFHRLPAQHFQQGD